MDLHWDADVAPGSSLILLHELWAYMAKAVSRGRSGSCANAFMEHCYVSSWGASTTQQEQICEAANIGELQAAHASADGLQRLKCNRQPLSASAKALQTCYALCA